MREKKIINHWENVNFNKILIICLVVMGITLLFGCTHKSDSNDVKNTVEPVVQDNQEKLNDEITQQFKVSDTSYVSIKKFLDSNSQLNHDNCTWDNSNTSVVFDICVNKDQTEVSELFLWKVGDDAPRKVTGVGNYFYPAYYQWASDGKHFFVNSGTACIRYGYIVSVEDLIITNEFEFAFDIAWSPDSKYMAISKRVEMETVESTELEGTTNMVILNIESGEEKIIGTGTAEYYFGIVKWEKGGELIYNKISFSNNEDKKECYYKN